MVRYGLSIAPWQIHLCAVRSENAGVRAFADKLCNELQSRGIKVIYDDRAVAVPGFCLLMLISSVFLSELLSVREIESRGLWKWLQEKKLMR